MLLLWMKMMMIMKRRKDFDDSALLRGAALLRVRDFMSETFLVTFFCSFLKGNGNRVAHHRVLSPVEEGWSCCANWYNFNDPVEGRRNLEFWILQSIVSGGQSRTIPPRDQKLASSRGLSLLLVRSFERDHSLLLLDMVSLEHVPGRPLPTLRQVPRYGYLFSFEFVHRSS